MFPSVLLTAILLTGTLGLILYMVLNMNASSEDKQKAKIGLVGDLSDSYLELGMHALQNLDSTRFSVEFFPMSEEEARQQLELGELTAYARIPDDLVESIMSGENSKITYVTSSGSAEIVTLLSQELMEVVSELLVEAQNAIYGMQRLLRQNGRKDILWEATDEINLRYFDLILARTDFYELEIVGVSNQLSLAGYYVCSMMLFFLLLWGIACSPLFVKQDLAMQKLLKSRGQSIRGQVAGEYTGYVVLMLMSFWAIGVALLLAANVAGITVPEWESAGIGEQLQFILSTLPVAAVIAAMQFFLFELVSGIVSGVLLQFLSAVCLGYVSGCFYPISFLPEGIQRLASVLPTGIALEYLNQSMLGELSVGGIAAMMGYAALFLGLTMVMRKQRGMVC